MKDSIKTPWEYFSRLRPFEQALIVVSLAVFCFLIVDPLVLQAARGLDEGTRRFFRSFTDFGKSSWILVPSGLAIIAVYLLRAHAASRRLEAGYGLVMQMLGFVFASVALAGLTGSLIKNILGRARPKFFDQLGAVEFEPFRFVYDYASFPSGHATTACAVAGAAAVLWPRGRVVFFAVGGWVAATRFLIGSHYFMDALAGALLGGVFPYLLRDRLSVRRWLFDRGADGQVNLRGGRLLRWTLRKVRADMLPPARHEFP